MKRLFDEAKKRLPEIIEARPEDIDLIIDFMRLADARGHFYHDLSEKSSYDLFDTGFIRRLIENPDDIVGIIKDRSGIRGFTHWALEDNIVWNWYTVIGETGNGLGKNIYTAFLQTLNETRTNFAAEFVGTHLMSKIYEFWERFNTLPMAFLTSKYTNNKGDVMSVVIGGRIFDGKFKGPVVVPQNSEEYARRLLTIHSMDNEVRTLRPTSRNLSKPGLERVISFNDVQSITKASEKGYTFTGFIPNNGMIFQTVNSGGAKNLREEIDKSTSKDLKEAFGYFMESLR